jgi:hypothetical protein
LLQLRFESSIKQLTILPSAAGGQPSMLGEPLCSLQCMTAKMHGMMEADSSARKNSKRQIHCRDAPRRYGVQPIIPIDLIEHCAKSDENQILYIIDEKVDFRKSQSTS